jgi:hypothetical protein
LDVAPFSGREKQFFQFLWILVVDFSFASAFITIITFLCFVSLKFEFVSAHMVHFLHFSIHHLLHFIQVVSHFVFIFILFLALRFYGGA